MFVVSNIYMFRSMFEVCMFRSMFVVLNIYMFRSITKIAMTLPEVLLSSDMLIDISFTVEQNVSIYHKFQTLRR